MSGWLITAAAFCEVEESAHLVLGFGIESVLSDNGPGFECSKTPISPSLELSPTNSLDIPELRSIGVAESNKRCSSWLEIPTKLAFKSTQKRTAG